MDLDAGKLRWNCPVELIQETQGQNLDTLLMNQDRLVRAAELAKGVSGYNLYISNSGNTLTVDDIVHLLGTRQVKPQDWVYVHNFRDSATPSALSFRAGMGRLFCHDLDSLAEGLEQSVLTDYSDPQFEAKAERIETIKIQAFRDAAEALNAAVQSAGYEGVIRAITGEFYAGKNEDGNTVPVPFEQTTPEVFTAYTQFLSRKGEIERDYDERMVLVSREREIAAFGRVETQIDLLIERYKNNPGAVDYLEDLKGDIKLNLNRFLPDGMPDKEHMPEVIRARMLNRYRANLVIDNSGGRTPVIIARDCSLPNLIGIIEGLTLSGMPPITDHTDIRVGGVGKANYGYLILSVKDLFSNPVSYPPLIRSLHNRELVPQDIRQAFGYSAGDMKPAPIPLDVKVVMLGSGMEYRILSSLDIDFHNLFTVEGAVEPAAEINEANVTLYARALYTLAERNGLKQFEPSALGRIIEYGVRRGGRKLSLDFSELTSVMQECDFYSGDSPCVTAEHVDHALQEKVYRQSQAQEHLLEGFRRGQMKISTDGMKTGQITALAVYDTGDYMFGLPTRVSGRLSVGSEGVIYHTRGLNGSVRAKSEMDVVGYMRGEFCCLTDNGMQASPLAVTIDLTFEQMYGGIDGDSASMADLCVILSLLSGYTLNQGIAITGSLNQGTGEAQAIGGVNEKIEGYFNVCRSQGLTGRQGVIIPSDNIADLQLDDEIVQAVREDRFHIYAVRDIYQAMQIMTGRTECYDDFRSGLQQCVRQNIGRYYNSLKTTKAAPDHRDAAAFFT